MSSYQTSLQQPSTKPTSTKAQQKHRTNSNLQRPPLHPQKSHNMPQTPITNPHHASKSSNFSQQISITQPRTQPTLQMQKLDSQFVKTLTQLQTYYTRLTKHQQIRVEKWIVKIIENDETVRWKQNRNNYLKLLYHIVKQNGILTEPFDKMPDMSKDLSYMSDHDFNQRTKPRFDGKSPVFHIHKPEMIKIDEPTGDNCSVLMSIINTARTTHLVKENCVNLIQLENKKSEKENSKVSVCEIKQSQLIEVRSNLMKNQFQEQQQVQKQDQDEISKMNPTIKTPLHCRQVGTSSVIPSNLPSQVKSFCNGTKIHQDSSISKESQQKSLPKYKNHSKYSNRNSIMMTDSRNLVTNNNKQSLGSSYLQFGKVSSIAANEQLKIYKELVLTMGKLLLKHEFAIQKQSEYWQLLRMIYSYQTSLKVSMVATPQRDSSPGNICHGSQNYSHSDRVVEETQSFEAFLSRLRQQVEHNIQKGTNLTSSPHLRYTTNESSDPRSSTFSNKQSIIQERHNFTLLPACNRNLTNGPTRKVPSTPIYDEPENMHHITQQSLDFKVEEGAQPEHLLYYELNEKPSQSIHRSKNPNPNESLPVSHRQRIEEKYLASPQYNNNSLMQISDSYRQVRRRNHQQQSCLSPQNNDYHNIYNETEEIQDQEICFTKQRLSNDEKQQTYRKSDLDGSNFDSDGGRRLARNNREYINKFDENGEEDIEGSPQFTDWEEENDQVYGDEMENLEEEYGQDGLQDDYQGESQPYPNQEEVNFAFRNSFNS